ncbi:MAG TPA: hypothetical protein VG964_00925 [Candidatus Saccharimonadales bacterium]|nr:hypothetical protein [Candidatus Saccharimonadales bacterium]
MSSPEVVAIVGGSRGTGAKLAEMILQDGGLVVVGYNSKPKRAEVVAGLREQERPHKSLDEPLYEGRAAVAQIDVTNAESRVSFAEEVERFAIEHGTTVSTLALLGAGGLEAGLGLRDAFNINAHGQVATARTFWDTLDFDLRSEESMTMFAQSFQGHTPFHPNPDARVPFPDMYAPIALSKQAGEIGLRHFILEYDGIDEKLHTLAVEVGEELTDSDVITLLKRRARDAAARVEAGVGTEEDEVTVEQMRRMAEREQEFEDAGLVLPTTADYAAMMYERIKSIGATVEDQNTVTDYLPSVALVNGIKTDLKETGNPLDWIQGRDLSLR